MHVHTSASTLQITMKFHEFAKGGQAVTAWPVE